MHNRYISSINFEDNDVADSDGLFSVVSEKEEVSPMERRFHTSTVGLKGGQ